MSTETTLPESTYPELKQPTFVSDIPPMLTNELSEADRYVLDNLSILKQYVAWSVTAQMQTHAAVRRTNGRVIALETWQTKVVSILSSWWGIAGAIITLIGGIAGMVEIYQFVQAHFGAVVKP